MCISAGCILYRYRLTATEIMNQLKRAYSDEEDPYDAINFIDVICNPDVERVNFQNPADISPLKRRIQDFQVKLLLKFPIIETSSVARTCKNLLISCMHAFCMMNLAIMSCNTTVKSCKPDSGKSLAFCKPLAAKTSRY